MHEQKPFVGPNFASYPMHVEVLSLSGFQIAISEDAHISCLQTMEEISRKRNVKETNARPQKVKREDEENTLWEWVKDGGCPFEGRS